VEELPTVPEHVPPAARTALQDGVVQGRRGRHRRTACALEEQVLAVAGALAGFDVDGVPATMVPVLLTALGAMHHFRRDPETGATHLREQVP
jgi:hypothetical protein